MSAHQHAPNTPTRSASGTWSRVSFCYPLYTINIYYEATSTHCPEILLLHNFIQIFWFTYFLHQHKLGKSWASISTRIKSYKLLLPTYIPTTRIQSPASWASISTRIMSYKHIHPNKREINHLQLEFQSTQKSRLTNYYHQHTSQQHKLNHLHLELQSAQESSLTKYSYQHTAQLLKHQYAKSLKLNIRSFCFRKYILWKGMLAWHAPCVLIKDQAHFSALHLWMAEEAEEPQGKAPANKSSK